MVTRFPLRTRGSRKRRGSVTARSTRRSGRLPHARARRQPRTGRSSTLPPSIPDPHEYRCHCGEQNTAPGGRSTPREAAKRTAPAGTRPWSGGSSRTGRSRGRDRRRVTRRPARRNPAPAATPPPAPRAMSGPPIFKIELGSGGGERSSTSRDGARASSPERAPARSGPPAPRPDQGLAVRGRSGVPLPSRLQ